VTRKEKAFKLFEEGKTNLDPKVKALGLKAKTRANYYYEWKKGREVKGSTAHGETGHSTKLLGGETIGGLDETKQTRKEVTSPEIKEAISQEIPSEEAEPENDLEKKDEGEEANEGPEEAKKEQKAQESIGGVSEVGTKKGKDGKPEAPEIKIATTIADDGIKCTVFLSLKTLALFKIASSTQAQVDGAEGLLLGDFIDTCVADFFSGRGKTLGLITTGGKK